MCLLEHKANANARNNSNATPLHHAAANNNVAVAKLLLAKNAQVNIASDGQWTPLRFALDRKNQEMADLLRLYGAK
jgi:ankyrin repeat protein